MSSSDLLYLDPGSIAAELLAAKRSSIAILQPETKVQLREDAIKIIAEMQDLEGGSSG